MNALYRRCVFYTATFFMLFPSVSWAVFVDLSTFITEDYPTLDGSSNWTVSGSGGTQVTQNNNSDPSIFRSGGSIEVSNKSISGEFSITGLDDDIVGFAFGYQNRGQMYLFGWKEQTQTVLKGMYLSRIDTGSPIIDPGRNDFANLGSDTLVTTNLRENDLSWERNITYSFDLNFVPGSFDISIYNGTTLLEMWTVSDATFANGDFGFFNSSQPGVSYGNLEVSSIPLPPSVWLFGSGLLGLIGIARRKKAA